MADNFDNLIGDAAKDPSTKKENPTPKKQHREKLKATDKKIKTSLYLPPDKMRRLKIHVAEEGTNISEFAEKAFDAQIKKDLNRRGNSIDSQSLDIKES